MHLLTNHWPDLTGPGILQLLTEARNLAQHRATKKGTKPTRPGPARLRPTRRFRELHRARRHENTVLRAEKETIGFLITLQSSLVSFAELNIGQRFRARGKTCFRRIPRDPRNEIRPLSRVRVQRTRRDSPCYVASVYNGTPARSDEVLARSKRNPSLLGKSRCELRRGGIRSGNSSFREISGFHQWNLRWNLHFSSLRLFGYCDGGGLNIFEDLYTRRH